MKNRNNIQYSLLTFDSKLIEYVLKYFTFFNNRIYCFFLNQKFVSVF